MRALEEVAHLLIDLGRNVIRIIDGAAAPAHVAERIALLLAILDGAQVGRKAVFRQHRAGDLGGVLNIGGRARGGRTEDQFLGGAAAHGKDQTGKQLVAGVHALVVFLRGHGMATGAAAGQDGDLVHALDVLERPRGQGVAALVVGGDLLLVLGDDLALAPWPAHHAVGGLFQRVVSNDVAADAGGEQGGLVKHIGQVRTGHAGGALGQLRHIDLFCQRLVLGVHAQNLLAAGQIRVGDRNLAVETARAQQCRVQDIGAVGGRDKDDALAVAESVHLHQQLVQGLLALIVPAAGTGTALAAHGVDLVHEDDARAVLLGLLEQVTHAGGTDTDEHLHEVRTGDGIKRHAGLARNGAGQQGLTGTRRAIKQHATRNLRAQVVVARRILQEVLDFLQLIHGLIGAGNILEGIGRHILGQLLGLGAADAEHAAGALLHAGHEPEQQAEEDDHRQQEAEHRAQERFLGDVGLVLLRTRILDRVKDLLGGARGILRHDLFNALALFYRDFILELDAQALLAVINFYLVNVFILQLF